jgi:ABC-type lipoprotein release transport system permease subunit
MRVSIAVLGASLAIPISSPRAQQPLPVEVGQRVRVTQCRYPVFYAGSRRSECERSLGTLSALSTNTLTVQLEGSATELAMAVAVGVLAIVALTGSMAPALRATTVSPVVALRGE